MCICLTPERRHYSDRYVEVLDKDSKLQLLVGCCTAVLICQNTNICQLEWAQKTQKTNLFFSACPSGSTLDTGNCVCDSRRELFDIPNNFCGGKTHNFGSISA